MLHYVNNKKLFCAISNNMIIKHRLDGLIKLRLDQLHDSPKQLFYRGADPNNLLKSPSVAIVGSRKMSSYGQAVTEKLARDLARSGVVVISGLALGVDSVAHRMSIEQQTPTIAVMAGGLDSIHPASHSQLAVRLLESGGSLISEYEAGVSPQKYSFIARNRIIAALADCVLITEAASKSGSLHTAEFALDLGKPVFAVPGPITSQLSAGTNEILKTGALLVTDVRDILEVLHIEDTAPNKQRKIVASADEQSIINALASGVSDGTQLLYVSKLDATSFAQALTMLEIHGYVVALGNNTWRLV